MRSRQKNLKSTSRAVISSCAGILAIFLLAGVSAAQQANPHQLLTHAIEAQQHGDFNSAIRDYRQVLAMRPGMVEARINLGAALAHEGQYDAAIEMYRSALPMIAEKNPVLLNMGLAYYKKGDLKDARERFEAVHQNQPQDVRTAILLGDTDVKMGKAVEAVSVLEPLEANNSQNLDFEYVFGSALINAGRRHDGAARLEKVAASGKMADAYMLAGEALLKANDFEPALRDLESALRLNPKLPRIYTLVGNARDKTGNIRDAEAAFREAVKVDQNDFDANLYLGAILYKNRHLDEAKPYLEHALQLNPSSSMARYEFAMWKSTAGQYDAAIQDLEKVIKEDPTWLEPHVQLATLYYKVHRPSDGARERQVVDRLNAEQQQRGPNK